MVMGRLGYPVSEDELDEMFAMIDFQGDGEIDLKDFEIMMGHGEKVITVGLELKIDKPHVDLEDVPALPEKMNRGEESEVESEDTESDEEDLDMLTLGSQVEVFSTTAQKWMLGRVADFVTKPNGTEIPQVTYDHGQNGVSKKRKKECLPHEETVVWRRVVSSSGA